MISRNLPITLFEHESIFLDKGEKRITKEQFVALQKYYGDGVPFYSLKNNGVQFNEYVGVIQIGKTIIEILPKADKNDVDNNKWRDILIGMLKAVGSFDIKATSDSNLKIKPNTILDLYFEMFIKEVEYLLHNGLIKQYRKKEGNVTALKGSLLFGKHIQENVTHQERFYVSHTTYDAVHKLHIILYKTIKILKEINTNVSLHSRIGNLLLHFPEMPGIKITESMFEKLIFTRKNQSYKKAIDIAKLILLKYHPDVSKGRNHVLALMFDMNVLWEKFVYVSLLKDKSATTTITSQTSKNFWKPEKGGNSKIRPDIVINEEREDCIVLDTKWKNLNGYNPSSDDLRQMYVYHEYYNSKKVALVYPGNTDDSNKGFYEPTPSHNIIDKECSIITLAIPDAESENKNVIRKWQEKIKNRIFALTNN